MTLHPLIARSEDHEVKQAKGFREAAAALTGEDLAAEYQQEQLNAPRRPDSDKKFLGEHPKKPPTARRAGRDEEHLSMGLVLQAEARGKGPELPEGGEIALVDYQVPLATAKADKAKGADDPNYGVRNVDLLGVTPDDRLAVIALKFVASESTRTGTGDTPLRLLLRALAQHAIVVANQEALREEVEAQTGRSLSHDPPHLFLVASRRYWQLCRKREAQKGAAWIKELERLARECEEQLGFNIRFLGLHMEGDPPWEYGESGPGLTRDPTLIAAWERNAGRVRPRARARAKPAAEAAETIVEADLSRPVRPYGLSESYAAGDRIEHPTLGTGVVQGEAGPGKIQVLFGERKSLLVHERVPAQPPA